MMASSEADGWGWLPNDATPLSEAAIVYASHGLKPIVVYGLTAEGRCTCSNASCSKPGKHPIGASWQKRATSDVDAVRDARRKHEGANVGIAVGECELGHVVVIDVDGEKGEATLAAWEKEHGKLPSTLTSSTGGGGRHLTFVTGPGQDAKRIKNSVGKLGPCVDVRARGGQIVAPPSRHASGTRYRWTVRCAPAVLPDALYEAIATPVRAASGSLPPASRGATPYVDAAIDNTIRRVAGLAKGQRNDQLNEETFNLARLVSGDGREGASVRASLVSAACAAGLSESEARDVVERAWRAGAAEPKVPPPPERQGAGAGAGGGGGGGVTGTRLRVVSGGGSGGSGSGSGGSDAPSWMSRLETKDNGRLDAIMSNLTTILRHDPRWAGRLRYDEFFERIVVRDPPWDPDEQGAAGRRGWVPWTNTDDSRLEAWMQRNFRGRFAATMIAGGVDIAARATPYHPVREYLGGLSWDGVERVSAFWSTYFGAPANAYHCEVARWLVSAVARVMVPGCKADTMVVLEGEQGVGKSTALKVLAGEAWFSDTALPIGSKDAFEQMRGVWIYEMGELDALNGKEVSAIKSFITGAADTYRPPYGKRAETFPRQCVFAGTTNDNDYLRDSSGARRFWPVECGTIDVDAIARDRDQIWAEAVALYEAACPWHIESRAMREVAAEVADVRFEGDPWTETIVRWLYAPPQLGTRCFSTKRVLSEALAIETQRQAKRDSMRVSDVMKSIGWRKGFASRSPVVRGWIRPDQPSAKVDRWVDRLQAIEMRTEDQHDQPDQPFSIWDLVEGGMPSASANARTPARSRIESKGEGLIVDQVDRVGVKSPESQTKEDDQARGDEGSGLIDWSSEMPSGLAERLGGGYPASWDDEIGGEG